MRVTFGPGYYENVRADLSVRRGWNAARVLLGGYVTLDCGQDQHRFQLRGMEWIDLPSAQLPLKPENRRVLAELVIDAYVDDEYPGCECDAG